MELFRRGEVLPAGRSTEAEEKLSGQATRFHPAPTSDMPIPLTDTFSGDGSQGVRLRDHLVNRIVTEGIRIAEAGP